MHLHDQTADLFPLLPHLLPWEPVVQAYRQFKVHHRVLRSQSDVSDQSRDATAQLNFTSLKETSGVVRLRDRVVSLDLDAVRGSGVRTYLQEALGVLQQVQPAVAAVVLLRNPTVGAPHGVGREETRRSPADLPLHLQVAEQRKPGLR